MEKNQLYMLLSVVLVVGLIGTFAAVSITGNMIKVATSTSKSAKNVYTLEELDKIITSLRLNHTKNINDLDVDMKEWIKEYYADRSIEKTDELQKWTTSIIDKKEEENDGELQNKFKNCEKVALNYDDLSALNLTLATGEDLCNLADDKWCLVSGKDVVIGTGNFNKRDKTGEIFLGCKDVVVDSETSGFAFCCEALSKPIVNLGE